MDGRKRTHGKGDKLPYLPIKNDKKAKDVVIYFLPRIEPEESSPRHTEIAFRWPKYLRQIGEEGSEKFSLNSVDRIQNLEFSYYLEPGTGKNLLVELSTPRQLGDDLVPATVKRNGTEWPGFSYKVKNGPAGMFKYELRVKLAPWP